MTAGSGKTGVYLKLDVEFIKLFQVLKLTLCIYNSRKSDFDSALPLGSEHHFYK